MARAKIKRDLILRGNRQYMHLYRLVEESDVKVGRLLYLAHLQNNWTLERPYAVFVTNIQNEPGLDQKRVFLSTTYPAVGNEFYMTMGEILGTEDKENWPNKDYCGVLFFTQA